TTRRPRARYVAPVRARLMVGLLRALPTRLADWIARVAVGFTRGRFAGRLDSTTQPFRRARHRTTASSWLWLLVFGVSWIPRALRADERPWQPVSHRKGIVVERRPVIGSNLMEFRGRGIVEAPLARVLAVFHDVEHATEWLDSCNASSLVEDVS